MSFTLSSFSETKRLIKSNGLIFWVIISDVGREEAKARSLQAKEHVKEMMATRDQYRDRRIKREEVIAQQLLEKAIKELYIEEQDRNKAKVSRLNILSAQNLKNDALVDYRET